MGYISKYEMRTWSGSGKKTLIKNAWNDEVLSNGCGQFTNKGTCKDESLGLACFWDNKKDNGDMKKKDRRTCADKKCNTYDSESSCNRCKPNILAIEFCKCNRDTVNANEYA